MLFFWDFNHYSTCGIGKRINSFVLGIEQSLSFFHLYLVEECSQFLYALILISAYICFKLIYVYDRSFGFFSFVLVSYVIRDFLFYFIFNTHGCIQRIYISFLLYLLGWKSFIFYDYSYFARPNFGMMCMPASSIVAEVVYFQRVMVSI